MAPEMVLKKYHDNRVDVWALGVITTELLFGHEPFAGQSKKEIYQKILHDEPNLSGGPKNLIKGGSPVRHFISKCLTKDIRKRPYPPELLDDPWIQLIKRSLDS